MQRLGVLFCTALALAVGGCQPGPRFYFHNDSDMAVRIYATRSILDVAPMDVLIPVAPGVAKKLWFARIVDRSIPSIRMIRAQAGDCEIAYQLPPIDRRYDLALNLYGVRLKPDLTVHLMAPEPIGDAESLPQPEGFPLTPVSRVCPGDGISSAGSL